MLKGFILGLIFFYSSIIFGQDQKSEINENLRYGPSWEKINQQRKLNRDRRRFNLHLNKWKENRNYRHRRDYEKKEHFSLPRNKEIE